MYFIAIFVFAAGLQIALKTQYQLTYKNVLSNRCWGSEKLKFPSKSTWIVLFWIPLSIFAILMFPGGEKRQYLNESVKFGLFWAKMRCWIINELCRNGTYIDVFLWYLVRGYLNMQYEKNWWGLTKSWWYILVRFLRKLVLKN